MRRFNAPKFNAPKPADTSKDADKHAKRHLASYNQQAPERGSKAREPLKEKDKNSVPATTAAQTQCYKVLYTKRNANKVRLLSLLCLLMMINHKRRGPGDIELAGKGRRRRKGARC